MALTAKQRRALTRLPKGQRAMQIERFNGQNNDSSMLRGIKQGVGKSVTKAFGSGPTSMNQYHPCLHDAFHMAHLPLPRPTGPYTVIRTTQLVTSSAGLMILGPVFDGPNNRWSNICGYGILDLNKTPGDANNAYRYTFENMNNASWKAAQVTPAAFSVQLMNPNALQTTSGIVYGGRVRTAFKITENATVGGNTIAQSFISYNMPRLMAAAKLAFRGVQVDGVPFNMSRLAEFTLIEEYSPGSQAITANKADYSGFNPQFYYNPSGLNLQYLVCCEWRVRFDPSNPAQASHVQHSHAEESIWMRVLHAAEAAGNGVIDIAERVADTGNSIFGATAATYRAGRGLKTLAAATPMLALGA